MPKKAKKYTNNVNTNAELNLIKNAFTGILSDTVPMITPSLIPSLDRLEDILVSAIAKKKPIQADDGTWTLVPNEDDPFVNKQYQIDFLKQDIIVVRAAKIEKVNFVEGEYKITFSNEKIKDYCYYAVVVQAPSGCAKPKGFTCVNFNPVIEEQERVFIP